MTDARRTKLLQPFPMLRITERALVPGDDLIYVWDIDKTWLDTRFRSLRDLVGVAFELGVDKHAVPGTSELIRALREGADGRAHHPLFFVSASPAEIAETIIRKMLLDGIEWDGITFKDQARLVVRREFDQVRVQIAYKLTSLLLLLREAPDTARFHLFGDDAESDALIYSVFADVAAGRLRGASLEGLLVAHKVRPQYAAAVAKFADTCPVRDVVEAIHIHLIRDPAGGRVTRYTRNVTGYPTFAAAAGRFLAMGLISEEAAERVSDLSPPSEPVVGAAAASSAGFWTPVEALGGH